MKSVANYQKQPGFGRSFRVAWRGLLYTWKTQGHLKLHVLAGLAVVLCAWRAGLSRLEWLVLILTIGSVIGAEMLNTAVELVVDLVQPNFHPLAGIAKDVAAGAVLISTLQAVVVGALLFFRPLERLLQSAF